MEPQNCTVEQTLLNINLLEINNKYTQFVIFKPLSYSFEEIIGFDVKASFASRPESCLIRWYNEPGDITKEFW